MKYGNLPSAERLHALLKYDPETGVITWKYQADRRKTWNTRFSGKRAGHISRGRLTVRIDGKLYFAHRIMWLMAFGSIPRDKQVDHINGDATDNRLSNLRLATNAENAWNGRLRNCNKIRIKGVSLHTQSSLWRARVTKNGKEVYTSYHDTPEDAQNAYLVASREHFGEFARQQ